MIADIRSKLTTNLSFLRLPVWKRNAVTAEVRQTYVDVQYENAAADPNNIAILDLNLRIPPIYNGTPLVTNVNHHRGLYWDDVHPTDNGAALITDTLAAFLGSA
ncbi:hypothetical protein SAMN05660748_0999 [Blastococcus aggregatus]|uniref:Uncharacterized protein n=1 Tax=Blastococcus aggregatus TaxID=38502 RepID=A0A285V102_9ACTN|nr:hypothetical protein [Blastococcus aggregatus]SOC47742.1 hypothetical protein SAMN05660748_0999 [Blastococcus aggregatus]